MKHNKKRATAILLVLMTALLVLQGSDKKSKFGGIRSVSIPSNAIIDGRTTPVITTTGKVGFVSSVTTGSLLSFSMSSGKIISSYFAGENAGAISVVECNTGRFIAVPAGNNPEDGIPATVTVLDATNTKELNPIALVIMPPEAHFISSTKVYLTSDGRFGVVASSYNDPALFCFSVETGEIVSSIKLPGRPSEIAFYNIENSLGNRKIAVASDAANLLVMLELNATGNLDILSRFVPSTNIGHSNNPIFSGDGRTVFIGSSESGTLYAVDFETGAETAVFQVGAGLERLSAGIEPDGSDLIACTRSSKTDELEGSNVSIFRNTRGAMELVSTFAPPPHIMFSYANNVVFSEDGSTAFTGSKNGILFAFNTITGAKVSDQTLGGEILSIAINTTTSTIAAFKKTSEGDEITILKLDEVAEDSQPVNTLPEPVIRSVSPDTVEQGRLRYLTVTVRGEGFDEGSSLLVNEAEVASDLIKGRNGLTARLPKSLFSLPSEISLKVKTSDGRLSSTAALRVVRPNDPTIENIIPGEIPGPSPSISVRIVGKNFRASSVVYSDGAPISTELEGPTTLVAHIPKLLTTTIGEVNLQVKDMALSELTSNTKSLVIYGPRVGNVKPLVESVVAGAGGFMMRVYGSNFRSGTQVIINDNIIPVIRVQRISSKCLKVSVPARLAEEAGSLNLVIRNRDGSASEPVDIDVLAPVITGFEPNYFFAGMTETRLNILGSNFRRGARVLFGDSTGQAITIKPRRVRFHSESQVSVYIGGSVKDLFDKPGAVKVQVVNPNRGDGVPSEASELKLEGPHINDVTMTAIQGNSAAMKMVLKGKNFIPGASIEVQQPGKSSMRLRPGYIRSDRITIRVPVEKLDTNGPLQVRVINPGGAASNESSFTR